MVLSKSIVVENACSFLKSEIDTIKTAIKDL